MLCTPGCECTLEELQRLPEAALNIVTNAELGLPLAEYLQKQYGTPYIFAGLPYGVQGTLLWLQQINAQLPAPAMDKVTAEAQAQDNYLLSRNNEAIALWGSMWFDNVLVSAPATQALCLAQTLRTEWTDIGRLTVICQQPLKDAPACDTAEAITLSAWTMLPSVNILKPVKMYCCWQAAAKARFFIAESSAALMPAISAILRMMRCLLPSSRW